MQKQNEAKTFRGCGLRANFILDSSEIRRGSIFDEKSGLRSHEQGNKTDSSIDEASGKSPRFIAKRQSRLDSSPQRGLNLA